MPFGSITLTPGQNVERTPLVLRSGYSQTNLIRYRDGLGQKYGGWQKYYQFAIGGIPRDLHAWQDLNNNGYLSIGTTTQLAVISNGTYQDISPQILISNFTPGLQTTINSNVVQVTDPNIANVTINDSVLFNTPVTIGGLLLFGQYQITQVTGTTSYDIQAATNATSNSTTTSIPQFGTNSGSSTVTVTLTAHGQQVGSSIDFPIATTGNGVTILGSYAILTVPNGNTFTIAASTQATNSGSFFMNGDQVQLMYIIALGPPAFGSGFGLGSFGGGGFGTGVVPGQQTGTDIAATSWTTGNWGQDLLACPINGGIYYWQPGSGFQTASLIVTAPPYNSGIFISNTQQIVVAYGSSVSVGIGFQQQSLLVQWSDVGNFFQWTANAETQAGNFVLSSGSKIIGGLAVANQNLLWTDLDLWSMNYIGPPEVFGFNKIGAGMGLASVHALQQLRGAVFWMGPSNFFVYSGGSANVIPCPVWDAVFQNLNTNFTQNICGLPNTPFNEIGWAFPSLASTTGENDSFVTMNILEPNAPWTVNIAGNQMQRSAWIDQSVLGNPIGAASGGLIFLQETTPDADGQPLLSSFTTGFFYLAEGEQFVFVDQIMPDFKWETFPNTGTSAQIQLTFNVVNFPGDTPIQFGPFVVTQATEYLAVRFRGRLMSVTVSSADLGSFWRLGSIKFRYNPSGRR